jgi:hypothetical protein
MVTNNKILFRFLVLFVTLLTIPFPFSIIPKLEFVQEAIFEFYEQIIPWIGSSILGLEKPITIFQKSSGDKTYDYVLLLLLFLLAVLGTIIWSVCDKKKRDYEKINYWFLTLIRYFLGYQMIHYGLFKIFPIQFGEIAFWKLLQPYGDSSPMGLAWTFLGYSQGYNLFMGLAEFIGGVLLFHKRTRLLGGLVLIPVITNIVAINFFYDVPVKLFSSELLFIAIIVVAPDFKRVLNFVIFNKPTESVCFSNPFENKKWMLGTTIMKWAFVFFILYYNIVKTSDLYETKQNKPELYGMYEVTRFMSNGEVIQPLLTDEKRWRYVFFKYPNSIQFARMDKSRFGLNSEIDLSRGEIKLKEFQDSTQVYVMNFKKTDSTLFLTGVFRNDTIICETKQRFKKDFRLTSSGFNLINEYPYNR